MARQKTPNNIRDLREQKQLSQDKVAEACGLTYSVFVRIEAGEGKTTQDEVTAVMNVLREMEPGTRKLAGRPFKDADKQAAVAAARENGTSVAEAMGLNWPWRGAIAPKRTSTKSKTADLSAALKKPRSRSTAKK